MKNDSAILITGAAGFIASCMASFLNRQGYTRLILMDDFSKAGKWPNHEHLHCLEKVERSSLENYLQGNPAIDLVIHFGARTDTTEMDYHIHETLNLEFSKKIWTYCASKQIPLIYASSAATYGDGTLGYTDDHQLPFQLQPLNPYGVSKNEFDKWALQQTETPPHWYGLKFFNVYGPNEYHKGRMASVIFHAFHQIREYGSLQLFRSHHPDYIDGGQMRDFIYVKDLISITYWLMHSQPENGLYNAGTGHASSFNELAEAIFGALNKPLSVQYIDTPIDIRDKYQYYTEADMKKLQEAGYKEPLFSLTDGVNDYIRHYLLPERHY